jgi:hypothetical protein
MHNEPFRLGKLETPVPKIIAEDDVEDTFHDAQSSAGSSQAAEQVFWLHNTQTNT